MTWWYMIIRNVAQAGAEEASVRAIAAQLLKAMCRTSTSDIPPLV